MSDRVGFGEGVALPNKLAFWRQTKNMLAFITALGYYVSCTPERGICRHIVGQVSKDNTMSVDFDFEGRDPNEVMRLIANMYQYPYMCHWYEYDCTPQVFVTSNASLTIGQCMYWVSDVLANATDIDQVRHALALEYRLTPYWWRDLFDAVMADCDAWDICGDCPYAVTDEYWLEDIVYPTAAQCYRRRAQARRARMSSYEQWEWAVLEHDVAVMVDGHLHINCADELRDPGTYHDYLREHNITCNDAIAPHH